MKEELYTDVISELMEPDWIDESWLKEQPKQIYRLDKQGRRYYYTFDDNGEPVFYMSVTSFIKSALPTSPFLIKWMQDNGDNAKDMADEAAHYGTFLHMQCGYLMVYGQYNLDYLDNQLQDYIDEHHLSHDFINHAHELKKDVLAFAQFMIDYNVTPLAIELILTHEGYGIAGAVDIVCEMDVDVSGYHGEVYKSGSNKGKPKVTKKKKRITAIVDIKSGRKGFYESHEIQLRAYKDMVEYNFPDIKIDKTFNWAPSAWKKAPSYKLKDQTEAKSAAKLDHLVKIAQIEDSRMNNSIMTCHGNISLKDGVYKNINIKNLSEMVKKDGNKTEPQQ